ncbi:MAG TPA: glucose 1-dehydrogenase [Gemmatimonadaceae bacterium]|nr:glucose 1-dehydrogenase [Gemmatimonadaceae bacterium]
MTNTLNMADLTPATLFSLAGRTAIVTGSGRGLGRTLAHGLAAAGARVVVADRSIESAHVVAAEVTAAGGQAAGTFVDITDRASCTALIAFTTRTFGRLDILVNNAAIDVIEPFTRVAPDNWRQIIDVDLTGAFNCSQLAVAHLLEQGTGGSIINITSLAATAAIHNLAAYSAAKAGLTQLTRVMALELAPHAIRVNAIAPGYLENVMAGADAEHRNPAKEHHIRAFTPLGRRARLTELVGPVTFLASNASSYVTGATLAVDGGYTAI